MVATTEPAPSQRGVAEVSQQLFDSVTPYHAAIGPGVNSSELAKLESKLLEEGRVQHRGGHASPVGALRLCSDECDVKACGNHSKHKDK